MAFTKRQTTLDFFSTATTSTCSTRSTTNELTTSSPEDSQSDLDHVELEETFDCSSVTSATTVGEEELNDSTIQSDCSALC